MRNELKKQHPLNQSSIYKLSTKKRLTEILGISKDELNRLTRGKDLYKEWDEINEKGKVRHIENPCHDLKQVQRRISKLLSRIVPPAFLFCPVKGRSYIKNAKQHVGQRNVCCLDIKSYFTMTLSRRVYWFFHSYMHCSQDVAGILTALSTVNGHLPTGSPLSPILAYFSHIDMWEDISNFVREKGCILTVYMDDITVSGENVSSELMWKIRRRIYSSGLSYHKAKRYNSKFSEITGVVVRDGKVALPNRQHYKKYQLQQSLVKVVDPMERKAIIQKLSGHNAQVFQIEAANNV